jgi:bifunctional enzyme CysN/CysC
MVRELTAPTVFLEIFVDTPLEECMRRDPKGSMRRQRPGVSNTLPVSIPPTSRPEALEIRVATVGISPEAAAERVLDELRDRKIIYL